MTSSEIQSVRDLSLRAMKRYPRGVAAEVLHALLLSTGIELARRGEESLDDQLLYLEEAGLAKRLPKRHTASLELWRLTAQGDDYLRSQGMA